MITDKDKKTIEDTLSRELRACEARLEATVGEGRDDLYMRIQNIRSSIALLSKPEEEQKPEDGKVRELVRRLDYFMRQERYVHTMEDADGRVVATRYATECDAERFLDATASIAPAPDMPVVTHLNIDPNASSETKQAVADMVKAAYNYAPPAPDQQKPEEQPNPFRELSDAHCERIAKRFEDEGEGSVHTGTAIGRARFLRWVRDHYYIP